MSGGKRRVSLWLQSLPQFAAYAPKFGYTEWDQLSAYGVSDLQSLGMPDLEATELAGIIGQLRRLPSPEAKEELASLRDQLVPLSSIKDNWLLVSGMLRNGVSDEIAESVHALHSALRLLKNLWYLEDSEWQVLRHRVKLGLVKDTKRFGNTSVSMGVAMTLPPFETNVGILNCGTGGIKYQMYNAQAPMHVVKEMKPLKGASPNALSIGSFKPKNPVTFEQLEAMVGFEMKQVPWKDLPDTPVYAFVTGTIRAHWETANDGEKAELEAAMERLFRPHGIKRYGESFFLPQKSEGHLELLGSRKMYENIVEGGLLDQGTEVVGSFGIGQGSCQWMTLRPDGQTHLIGHKAGMSNIKELAGVVRTVLGEYRESSESLHNLIGAMKSAETPVIALKSGCLLLLDMSEFEMLRRSLTGPPREYLAKTVRIVRNGSDAAPVELRHTGSLDLLCAEASRHLGTMEDFETAYREDGSIADRVMGDGELLIFAPLDEPFRTRAGDISTGAPVLPRQDSLELLVPPMLVPQRSMSVPESVIHLDPPDGFAGEGGNPQAKLIQRSSRGRGSVIAQARSAQSDASLGLPGGMSRESSIEAKDQSLLSVADPWGEADEAQVSRVRSSLMRKGSVDQFSQPDSNQALCCVPKCRQKLFVNNKYCMEHTRLFSHRTEWATSDEVTHDWQDWTGGQWVAHLKSSRLLAGDVTKLAEALYEAEDEGLVEGFGDAGGIPLLGSLIAAHLPLSTTLNEQGFVVYEKKEPGRAEKIAQECLRCLKLLLDYESVVTLILASPDLIDTVALCLHFHNLNFRSDALEFMIVLIWISAQGCDCVHEALKHAQKVFRRSHAYSVLFDLLRHGVYGIDHNLDPRHTAAGDIWDSDPSETKLVLVDLKSLSLVFLNSVLQAKQNLEERTSIRAQLLDMGLQSFFAPLVRWTGFHSSHSAKRLAQNNASKQEKMACMLMERHCEDIESNIRSFEEDYAADRQIASLEDLDFTSSQALAQHLIDFTSEHPSSSHFLSLLQTLCLLPADASHTWKNIHLMALDATSHLRGSCASPELTLAELKTFFQQRAQVPQPPAISETTEAATKKLYMERAKTLKLEGEVTKLKREVDAQKTLRTYLTHVITPVNKNSDAYNATIRPPPPPLRSASTSLSDPSTSTANLIPPPPLKLGTTISTDGAMTATAVLPSGSSVTSTTSLLDTTPKTAPTLPDALNSPAPDVKPELSELETLRQALDSITQAKAELERRLAELEGGPPPEAPDAPPPPEAPSAPGAPPAPFAGALEPSSIGSLPPKPRMKPGVAMRKLHWTLVPAEAVTDSLWDNIKEEEVSLNIAELEEVFGEHRRPRAQSVEQDLEHAIPESEVESKAVPAKRVEQVRLVDRRRAQNADISLARFRKSPSAIRDALLAVDLDVLTEERLSQLIAICPTKEEVELVAGFAGAPSELGLCERFILAVKDIPNLPRRLGALLFKQQSEQLGSDLRDYCECVSAALKQLTNSKRFREVLRHILALGNYMNGGSSKGQAYGFQLTSLPRLVTTKSTDGKSNLLQYLIGLLHRLDPHLLTFTDELSRVKEAATMEQANVEQELARFKEGHRQASLELQSPRAASSEDSVPDQFESVMKGFCFESAREIGKLTAKHSLMLDGLEQALKYFGLEHMHWEQLFRLVSEFTVTFKRELDLSHKHLNAPPPPSRPRSVSQIVCLPDHVRAHHFHDQLEEEEDWEAPGAGRKKVAHQVMGTLRKGSSAKLTAVMTKRRLHLEGMSSRTMKQAGLQLVSPRN